MQLWLASRAVGLRQGAPSTQTSRVISHAWLRSLTHDGDQEHEARGRLLSLPVAFGGLLGESKLLAKIGEGVSDRGTGRPLVQERHPAFKQQA